MRKLVFVFIAILFFIGSNAQQYRMQVVDNQSNTADYEVSALRSLVFPDAEMHINLKSGGIDKIAKSNVKKIVFYLPTSTEQLTDVKLKIYTSTDNQSLSVNYPLDDNAKYAVYSIDGRARLFGQLSKGENAIEISNLPAGIYLFKANNTVQKFIKK